MSWLNLNKFLPARKAWKIFSNKVQSKLHKLNRSRTIKKPKNRLSKTSKRISWPGFCNQPRVQRKRFKRETSQTLCYHTNYFQTRPSPVYIDQLFFEPVSTVKEHLQPPINATAGNKGRKKEVCPSSAKKAELVDVHESMAGTSMENGESNGEMHSADDMWESLVLASPQMNGINERAEEFITRFRAEMRLQEQLPHHL